ncbi:ATPase synthesis protein 25 mitochondrial [Saitoella coloradoensis]
MSRSLISVKSFLQTAVPARHLQPVVRRSFVSQTRPCAAPRVRPHASGLNARTAEERLVGEDAEYELVEPKVVAEASRSVESAESAKSVEAIESPETLSPSGESASASVEEKPWYLLNDDDIQSQWAAPVTPIEVIPDLPENPPDFLERLLNYLSSECNLLDLRILDLRNCDPPAAWGEQTIMIVGTAKAERHLRVAGEDLMTWLRKAYNLRPWAEGLPREAQGKIVARRRRKNLARGKIESPEDARNNWVCVDTGRDCLVVHMFTEAGREQINLEGLWEEKLRDKGDAFHDVKDIKNEWRTSIRTAAVGRQSRGFHTSARRMMAAAQAVLRSSEPEFSVSASDDTISAPARASLDSFRSSLRSSGYKESHAVLVDMLNAHPELREHVQQDIRHLFQQAVAAADYNFFTKVVRFLDMSDSDKSFMLMEAHLQLLQRAWRFRRHSTAYIGLKDFDLTPSQRQHIEDVLYGMDPSKEMSQFLPDTINSKRPFLTSWRESYPERLTAEHFHLKTKFYITAHQMQPLVFARFAFRNTLSTMQASGIDALPETFYAIMDGIATSVRYRFKSRVWRQYRDYLESRAEASEKAIQDPKSEVTGSLDKRWEALRADVSSSIREIMQVAETMHKLGWQVDEAKVYNSVYLACCPELPTPEEAIEEVTSTFNTMHGLQWRAHARYARMDDRVFDIEQSMIDQGIPLTPAFVCNQLIALATVGQWVAFWRRWRSIASAGIVRDSFMYTLLWALLVRAENRKEATHGLAFAFEEMQNEWPAVEMTDDLARVLLKVADLADSSGLAYENVRNVASMHLQSRLLSA